MLSKNLIFRICIKWLILTLKHGIKLKLHENDDVNKTVLLLLCISDAKNKMG